MCKVSIRTATEQDIPAILAIYGPYVEITMMIEQVIQKCQHDKRS